MNTDKRLEPGTRIRLKGWGLPPRYATIVQSTFRKMPVGWVIVETDDGSRELVHALRGDSSARTPDPFRSRRARLPLHPPRTSGRRRAARFFHGANMPQPTTKNGLPMFAALSALQKCIRRGLEREAMQFAVELISTSKSFHAAVCNRLEVIGHEDIGDPLAVLFVRTACEQARAWHDKPGESRLAIGNAIRLLCRAPKSREGCHFAAAVGLASELEGYVPSIPDWALDMHTTAGKRRGRGIDHFLAESALLVPPAEKNAYADEAARLWRLKARRRPGDKSSGRHEDYDNQDDGEPRLL
jgi:hypothetical protein